MRVKGSLARGSRFENQKKATKTSDATIAGTLHCGVISVFNYPHPSLRYVAKPLRCFTRYA